MKLIKINMGFFQGCGLFCLILIYIYQQNNKVIVHHTKPKGTKISKEQKITHLTYADDQILLASSKSSYGTKFHYIRVTHNQTI